MAAATAKLNLSRSILVSIWIVVRKLRPEPAGFEPTKACSRAFCRAAGTGQARKASSSVAGIEPAEDRHRDRIEDLLAGLVAADHQGDQRDSSCQRRHEHRRQAFERAADHHPPAELFALEQHEIDVVADLQDAVTRRDARERDEADGARHRERLAGDPQRRDAAYEGERHVAHDDQRQRRRAVAAIQHDEDQQQRDNRQRCNAPGRLFLRLELALEAE